ncbi:DNA replication complex GINS protein PSF2 [Aphelenchoides bicaudatus]|nr:DNA replication complex GINS protein PSF2 [Aphelenchoides bicaudatus]
MDFEDCEFLAEDAPLTILPNFASEPLSLFGGYVGPFEAGIPTDVPLWLGLYLKRRHKCTIAAPEWMNIENLTRMVAAEAAIQTLTRVPEHYVEISKIILNKASDDIADADQLMTLIMDLRDKREAKLRTSIQRFVGQAGVAYAALTNLTRFEAAHFRPFLEEMTAKIDMLNDHRHFVPKS